MKVKEFLGFGDFYTQLQNFQRQIVVEGGPPPSSKYGDVKVCLAIRQLVETSDTIYYTISCS